MPLLAFLHGAGQSPQSWQDQVTALPTGWKAFAPWLRGTRPGKVGETFSVEGAADDVLALLNQNGVESMALCGLSLGAVVALDAAVRAPDAVSHLVLVAGQVRPPKLAMKAQELAMRAIPAARFAGMGVDKAKLLEALREASRIDYRRRLGDVRAATLVVVGENDKANRAAAEELAAGIAGARLEVVAGGGHEVNVDSPGTFNELLYGFLPAVPPQP